MNELYYFSEYLEQELQRVFNNSSNSLSNNKTLDIDRINDIHTAMKILGEYEHYIVNQGK